MQAISQDRVSRAPFDASRLVAFTESRQVSSSTLLAAHDLTLLLQPACTSAAWSASRCPPQEVRVQLASSCQRVHTSHQARTAIVCHNDQSVCYQRVLS